LSKAQKQALKEEIRTAKNIADKNWLLEKVSEYE